MSHVSAYTAAPWAMAVYAQAGSLALCHYMWMTEVCVCGHGVGWGVDADSSTWWPCSNI